MSTHSRYPAYKASGIDWLGDVPEHWEEKRLKYSASINDEALAETTDPEYCIEYVDISSVDANKGIVNAESLAFADAPSRARRVVKDGDIIVSTVRTYLRAIAPVKEPRDNLIVSTGFAVVRPAKALYTGFASYTITAPYFVERVVANSVGVSYPAINASELGTFPVLLPPLPEQQAIADYLDHQTGRIDSLIARKEALMALLKEKRSALITEAVTKGLDPAVPMKDSGIDWLGEVPEHWEMKRLKYTSTINDETLPETTEPDRKIDYVEIGSVDANKGIVNTESFYFEDAPSRARRIVRGGDIIISTVRTYLRAIAPIDDAKSGFIVSTGFAVIRPQKVLRSRYAAYSIMAPYFVERVVANSVGVSYPAINASELGIFEIPLPPLPEQQAIADYLDSQTAKIDALFRKVEIAIEKLTEYRTALITAAVTGQIDVRG